GAVVAGAQLFNLTHLPVMLVALLLVTWVSHRMQSMGPSLVATIVFSTAILGITFGALPSLTRPVNQLPGKWQPIDPAPGIPRSDMASLKQLKFLHGGAAESDEIQVPLGQVRTDLAAWHYDWIGDDTIRVVWIRDTVNGFDSSSTRDWQREDY